MHTCAGSPESLTHIVSTKISWIQVRTPFEKSQNIGFSSNTCPDPLKNRSCEASIQCWAFIGMPAKRHLIAFRRRADDGPLKVGLGSSLPSSTLKTNVVKVGSPLTKHSGSAHESCPSIEPVHTHCMHARIQNICQRG